MRPSSWLPSLKTTTKLFITGATVGPIVDSLHNQCLLQYETLPISLGFPDKAPFFVSSWLVPPLLGIAYVVLGGFLPRLIESLVIVVSSHSRAIPNFPKASIGWSCRKTAITAILVTAFIIQLSELLETHPWMDANKNIAVLMTVALLQWLSLDGSMVALIVASVASIGGPLSELPFVANHVWQYLPEAGNYLPLKDISENALLESFLGDDYKQLALSSITGPCYFAVTMDAIALGRWFDQEHEEYN